MHKGRISLAVFAVVLLASAFAYADILYNNGGPNQQNGNEMTQWLQSETFSLSQTSNIDSFTFWDIEAQGGTSWQGSFQWWITGDLNGNPDFNSVRANGASSGADVQRMLTNNDCNVIGLLDTSAPSNQLAVRSTTLLPVYTTWYCTTAWSALISVPSSTGRPPMRTTPRRDLSVT